MVTRIFFVRHGEVNNPNKICYGRLPGFPLSPLGEREITHAAQQLSKSDISTLYASPLLRTEQSAEIISNILHLPIHYSDDLLEVKSPMQGKLISYIRSNTLNFNIFASKDNRIDGETIEDVARRMRKFISRVVKTYAGKNIIAVTHGDPIMIIKAQIEGLPIKLNSIRPINRYIKTGEVYMAEFNF